MDDNYVLKEGSPTSPMLDEHSTATIIEKTVDVSDIGEFIIGESNSSIITFRMNRYYDGVDLLEKTIKVMYRNSNGIFESDVVNIKYTSNSLKFSWIVPHDATTSKKLLAYVCFVSDGYLWKTKTFTITVDQSFDVGDSEPTQNWFVNIESKLTKIEKTIDEAVGKLSEQIPTKVSDLENDLAVSYSAQELTSEQKQQVRENIDIGVSKKVVTYDGASSSYTILISEGTVNDITSDSTEEFIEAYKIFYSAVQLTRLFPSLNWGQSKILLKRLSDAHKAGVIPDKLTYSTDISFTKVMYSYAKNTNSEYYDSILFVSNKSTIRLCYYPDKDEYSTSSMDNYMQNALIEHVGGTDNTDSYVGQFNMHEDPISDMQVATKQYVDKNSTKIDETLTTEQKATIRDNINAIGYDPIEIPLENNNTVTIYHVYGTFTPPTDENKNDTDYQSVYKTFTNQFIICRIIATLNWQLAKNMVKAFSAAYDKGIISENFMFYSDDIYSKLTKFERTVNSDGTKVDTLCQDYRGKLAKLTYYPDTDTFSENSVDSRMEQPLLLYTAGFDKDYAAHQFEIGRDPQNNMEIATKQYVDNNTMYAVQGRDCPESLDTMINSGYCYIQEYSNPYPSGFPDTADKTKDSVLICYRQTAHGCARQVLYNGTDKVFTRYGYPEMGNIIWNDWTDFTSSPTMYIHVTSEEKDGGTVYKSDKTYEEITTALTENKIVVVNYENQSLFYSDASIIENTYIFCNNDLIVMIRSDTIIATELPISFVIPATYTETDLSNPTFTVDDSDIEKMHVYAKLYGTLPDVLLTVVDYNRKHKVLLSSASQYDFNSMSVTYYWDCVTTRNERNSTTDNTRIYCRLSYNGIMNTFCEYSEQTILPIDAPHISDISDYNQVVVSDSGYLYAPKTNTVSYYPTMDKVSNSNTVSGRIAIVYAKGSSNIDVAYPAVVFSTETQSYGIFDGWIVDANGNHYSCTIRSSGVTLGSKTVRGMPQPTKKDANKVLYGDMTWKDALNITDEHINTLIDKKLGVIENGTY